MHLLVFSFSEDYKLLRVGLLLIIRLVCMGSDVLKKRNAVGQGSPGYKTLEPLLRNFAVRLTPLLRVGYC